MVAIAVSAAFPLSIGAALELNFRPEPGTAQEAVLGFEAAGELWSDLYRDDIVVNIDIGFRDLGVAILGQTGSNKWNATYDELRTALSNDAISFDDQDVVSNLSSGPSLAMLLNRTSNSQHGPGDPRPYLDDDGDENNVDINMTRANAKALRLLVGHDPGTDAAITFNSSLRWDFDRSDGVDQDAFNFLLVAAHEIGHALGFVSGVDVLDGNSPPHAGPFADDAFVFVSPVDVYRFSAESVLQGQATVDFTADTRRKYFAIDGGSVDSGGFSTGRNFGDGRQASHWQDDLGLGIMDPTAAPGEDGEITLLDRRLFDVIGYDDAEEFEQAGPADAAQLDIEIAMDQAILVLELTYDGGMIAQADRTPFVRVYSDGRVLVHYPRYTVKSGDYMLELTAEELRALLGTFAKEEIVTLDQSGLDALTASLEVVNQPAELPGDHGVTANVQVNFGRISPAGGPLTDVELQFALPAAVVDLAASTPVKPLQDIAAGINQLEALSEHPNLTEVSR
jgi:hypothetical protein